MPALLSAVLLSLGAVTPQDPDPPPNFVVVLADDQGWTGTSVAMDRDRPDSRSDYYRTPHLERLARQGMRFSNAYAAAPNCSPSRASLQTGRSPARLGMTDIIGVQRGSRRYRQFYAGQPLLPPVPIPGLPEEDETLAERLGAAGYTTGHFGKWHLAGGGPGNHGYDHHDGARGSEGRQPPDDPKDIFGVTESACAFLADRARDGAPFYLQVSHFAVHLPIRAREETEQRCAQREKGEHHRHAAHAAMTEDLDTGLGILLDRIEELGLAETTYVIYTSDNGAYTHNGVTDNLPLAKGKASVWEGGIRVPFVVRGPGVPADSQCDVPVLGWDLLPTVSELAGLAGPLPEDLDGGSFAGLLDDGEGTVERADEALIWHFPHYQTGKGTTPQSAIRVGDDKLIEWFETGEYELFDLAGDLGERHGLADRHPDRADALHRQLHDRLAAMDAAMPVRQEWPRRIPLAPDADLPRSEAPLVEGHPFTVDARIDLRGDGVVVAQGGAVDGWALFVRDGRPTFVTRHDRRTTTVTAPGALAPGSHRLHVHLARDGAIVLEVDGEEAARGRAPSPLTAMPRDGLQVGRDRASPVGPYGAPFPLGGEVHGVVLELGER